MYCDIMLIFTHVPKTGGTSIARMMELFLRTSGIESNKAIFYGRDFSYDDMKPLSPSRLERTNLLCGHLVGKHLDAALPKASFCLISIRDPASRFISRLEHVARIRYDENLRKNPKFRIAIDLIDNLCDCPAQSGAISRIIEDFHISPAWGEGRNSCSEMLEHVFYRGLLYPSAWISLDCLPVLANSMCAHAPGLDSEAFSKAKHSNIFPRHLEQYLGEAKTIIIKKCYDEVCKEELLAYSLILELLPSVMCESVMEMMFQSMLGVHSDVSLEPLYALKERIIAIKKLCYGLTLASEFVVEGENTPMAGLDQQAAANVAIADSLRSIKAIVNSNAEIS